MWMLMVRHRHQWHMLYHKLSHSGELQMQKLKPHLVRTQSLNILPLKPMLHLLPGISSLLISALRVRSPAFFPNLSWFSPVLAVANTGSCVGPQNKIGHPAECRCPCWEPTEHKQAKKTWLVVWWLVKWITWSKSEVCVQPWCNPLRWTGLKAPSNQPETLCV